jgi:hypothetical protein
MPPVLNNTVDNAKLQYLWFARVLTNKLRNTGNVQKDEASKEIRNPLNGNKTHFILTAV